jgi:hypothetical protein
MRPADRPTWHVLKKVQMLTAKRLQELLSYEPETGLFRWRVNRCGGRYRQLLRARAGDVAGDLNGDGYWRIGVDGRRYKAHRLAWLYMTGEWAAKGYVVEHRDRDPLNNRWSNLRLATQAQNTCNTRKRSDNRSGFKGVSFAQWANRYRATIYVGRKQRHLGYFDTAKKAARAYARAARKHHGSFARWSS